MNNSNNNPRNLNRNRREACKMSTSADGVRSSKSRGKREYGYTRVLQMVRVPQLGFWDLLWIGLALVLSNFYMLIMLVRFYLNMEDYSHAILVPIISGVAAWKVLKDTDRDKKPEIVGDFRGLPLIVLGLVLQFGAMWYDIGLVSGGVAGEYVTSVGLVLTIWGIAFAFLGVRGVRTFWFPLLYLVFLIPGLPGPPEAILKNTLRDIVTAWSAGALRLFGFSVLVEGNVITIPDVRLGVEDACSGIRSLWAMLAVAPAIAWFLRLRPFLIALFIPLGIFLAIFQNFIRVVATALFCHWDGSMDWAEGTRHDIVGGASFFLVSMIMVVLARIFAPPPQGRKEGGVGDYGTYGVYGHYGTGSYGSYGAYHAANDPEKDEGEMEQKSAEEQREVFYSRIFRVRTGVFVLLGFLFLAQMSLFQRYAVRSRVQYMITQNRETLDTFPGEIGPYTRIFWGELPDQAVRILRPSESYVAWYSSREGKEISVIINFWQPVIGFSGNYWVFPHNPDVCFREAGWEKIAEPEDPEWWDEPNEVLYSRLYANEILRSHQMVLYWYNMDYVTMFMNQQIDENVQHGSWRHYTERLRHVARSWKYPKEYSRFQYSVGIYVQQQGTVEETIELARDFAKHLRGELEAFGLQPLQNFEEDRSDPLLVIAD